MGKRDYRGLENRMRVLLIHLLKWRYQDEKRSRSWRSTIQTQRDRIELILRDSPSFRRRIVADMNEAYSLAVVRASIETTIPEKNFHRMPVDIRKRAAGAARSLREIGV
jgi:hypothetical protein